MSTRRLPCSIEVARHHATEDDDDADNREHC
jgi:hypothetical protein